LPLAFVLARNGNGCGARQGKVRLRCGVCLEGGSQRELALILLASLGEKDDIWPTCVGCYEFSGTLSES
jgi:hypothetical protein